MFKQTLLITCLSLFMFGCAQTPQPQRIVPLATRTQYLQQLQSWQISGRVAIADQNDNINASFTWQQDADKFKVHFFSPYTTDSVHIVGDSQNIKITATTGDVTDDVHLEKQLPLAQMSTWLKGLAVASSVVQLHDYDRYNQLKKLQQDGWLIEYNAYHINQTVSLPEKINFTDGTTRAKFLIKRWQLNDQQRHD